jgi:hypothetical protein
VKADRGWKRAFEDPIDLPNGRKLVTLQDAGNYITQLPKAEHIRPNACRRASSLDRTALAELWFRCCGLSFKSPPQFECGLDRLYRGP